MGADPSYGRDIICLGGETVTVGDSSAVIQFCAC